MPLSLDEIRAVIADAVAPRHFFVGNGLELDWQHTPAETIPWEIYKGRLLDASQTRETRAFEAWNIYSIDEFGRSTEPLLSVKLDAETGQIHIVRAILCYAWEAYDAGDNVILSRETTKWMRELVGTIESNEMPRATEFPGEVRFLLYEAVLGTSRLPLTSGESPLPAFLLGRLAYFYGLRSNEGPPVQCYFTLLAAVVDGATSHPRPWTERARILEAALRAVPSSEVPGAAEHLIQGFILKARLQEWKSPGSSTPAASALCGLLETLFNETTLSPYTNFVEKVEKFLRSLQERGSLHAAALVSIWTHILRQLGRHLTAYDLVTFHHQGANYPDALLLDAALKECLRLVEQAPDVFLPEPGEYEQYKRLRRRALRQGMLLRRLYEGHLVPDAPTSPGENARVLPPPHVRVPEEQITDPQRRTRRLFKGDSLDKYLGENSRAVLRKCIQDLENPSELRELGMAIFLDRPLGAGKGPMEPDRTPLFSYVAFSRSIALQRLNYLTDELNLIPDRSQYESYRCSLEMLEIPGIPVRDILAATRPAAVSLADAYKAAEDFLILKNTFRSLSEFLEAYDFGPLWELVPSNTLHPRRGMLILPSTSSHEPGEKVLAVYNHEVLKCAELAFDTRLGYVLRKGVEYPASPLRILRVWQTGEAPGHLMERDVSGESVLLTLNDS